MKEGKRIARKVASRYVKQSSEWAGLAPVMLQGASQAQIALAHIETMVDRAISLVDASEQKEHIYSEAGDLITGVRGLLTEASEGIAILSYAASKVNEKKMKGSFPPDIKEDIDKAIKKGNP